MATPNPTPPNVPDLPPLSARQQIRHDFDDDPNAKTLGDQWRGITQPMRTLRAEWNAALQESKHFTNASCCAVALSVITCIGLGCWWIVSLNEVAIILAIVGLTLSILNMCLAIKGVRLTDPTKIYAKMFADFAKCLAVASIAAHLIATATCLFFTIAYFRSFTE